MPGQYPTRGAVRPRLCDEAQQADATGRFFSVRPLPRAGADLLLLRPRQHLLRARLRSKVPTRGAARSGPTLSIKSSGGRRNHAERARAYRARQKKVTHQGSPRQPTDDVMPKCAAVEVSASSGSVSTPQTTRSFPLQAPWHCCWCGRPCAPFVRRDFLRRGRDP
jgi:hypothetical protein